MFEELEQRDEWFDSSCQVSFERNREPATRMGHTSSVASTSAIYVVESVPESDTSTIERLIELGNGSKKTLGLLPKAAYHDAAQKGFLYTVREGATPIGYTLFRLPRNEVAITHLCVLPEYRRRGVAQELVNAVSRNHQGRIGIRVKCRDDYTEIQKVWRGLGFKELGRAKGRGKDNAPMTVWWLDHGHPDLFTSLDEAPVLQVAIDVNIVMDLKLRPKHPTSERSQVLLAPEVDSNIELVVPRGLERDIERHPENLRDRLTSAANTFKRPPPQDSSRVEALFDQLLRAVRARIPTFPKSPQDTGDLWQLAESAVSGLQVFLTWDLRLRNDVAPIVLQMENVPELSRLRIIDPDHLVIHLDELAHAAAYQPRALEGSHFSTELAGSESEATLMAFLNKTAGESAKELRERLHGLAKIIRSVSIVRDSDRTPVGCSASFVENGVLRVPLLRIADHKIAETMARRLLWDLRVAAREHGAKVVKIEDPYLTPLLSRAASHEQYQHIESHWYAWVIDTCGSGLEVSTAVAEAHRLAGVDSTSLLAPGLPAEVAASYERAWWPAKITDSGLPHFAVAIRPSWSAELFGRPAILTPRSAELALGREQVYYRSGHNSTLSAPGRILWYLSKDPRVGPAQFIGTSLLDAIETGTPEQLYQALNHFGVFSLRDIEEAANKHGLVQALRLSDTEMFPVGVRRKSYDELLERGFGGPRNILAPARVPRETFEAIYKLGTGVSAGKST